MHPFFSALLALMVTPWCEALAPITARGRYLTTDDAQLVTINGIWYATSNSTTDRHAMDPLKDAEACRRDAALMARLGINTIQVQYIKPDLNHDDCFSIFNSVGIYIVINLRRTLLFGANTEPEREYNEEAMRETFEIIDAVKDYENLMAIDIGMFPYSFSFGPNPDRFGPAQKATRAIVRDTKHYVARHAQRKILIGASFNTEIDGGLLRDYTSYMSCQLSDEQDDEVSSVADYISFNDMFVYDGNRSFSEFRTDMFKKLSEDLFETKVAIPTWLMSYGTVNENREVTMDTITETKILYSLNTSFVQPRGPLAGGTRFQWTNAAYSDPNIRWSLVDIDSDGNAQLTERYDELRGIFDTFNTGTWLSGGEVPQNLINEPQECKEDILLNKTLVDLTDNDTTFTLASNWDLPTRPVSIASLITNGASGTRGQMVDVVTTTMAYTIRDSDGNVMTNVALSPSSSERRTTTSREESTGAPPSGGSGSGGMSTGAKAGVGVGVAVGVLGLAGGALFFLLRRRRSKKNAATPGNVESVNNGMGSQPREKGDVFAHNAGNNSDSSPGLSPNSPSQAYASELPAGGPAGGEKSNTAELNALLGGPSPVELPASNAQELDGYVAYGKTGKP